MINESYARGKTLFHFIVPTEVSLTAPLQPGDSGEPSGAGAKLALHHERRRVSSAEPKIW